MRRHRPDRAAQAVRPDDPAAARLSALKLLNRRDFCAAELAGRLAGQGFDADLSAATVAQLAAERLVDDARFAEHYVTWHAGRGQGPLRIAHALRELGVEAGLVDSAVDAGAAAWRQRCARVRRRRFGDAPPEEWKDRGRQARFLQFRGFSADQVRAALGTDIELDE